LLRCTDASAPPRWTGTHPGHLRPPKTPYAAPTHGNGSGRATRRASVHPRAAASMQRTTWPLPQPFTPYPSTGRAASPRSAGPCSVSRAPGPELGRAEPSRARPPPSCHRQEALSRAKPRPTAVVLLPLALLNPAASPPVRLDAPSPACRGCSGLAPSSSPPAPGKAAPGPIFGKNRSRVSSLTFLDPRPAKSGAHRPGIPAAGVGSPPKDYIAREKVFPGRFMQVSRDPAVKVVLGLQQQLRKIIKNRRKIRKMQNQFCWFRGEEIYLF
jgi:hypothetical protein